MNTVIITPVVLLYLWVFMCLLHFTKSLEGKDNVAITKTSESSKQTSSKNIPINLEVYRSCLLPTAHLCEIKSGLNYPQESQGENEVLKCNLHPETCTQKEKCTPTCIGHSQSKIYRQLYRSCRSFATIVIFFSCDTVVFNPSQQQGDL